MKRFLISFLPLLLFGTVNEPLRLEMFSGYRNDRVHWHLQQPGEGGALTYSELYRDLEFWENGLVLKTIHRDLVFYARGSYGAFGRGTIFQRYADLSFTSEQPRFRFDPNGWTADALGYFGYAVNLTDGRTYKVLLIPLVGYSAHFEHLKRTGGSPNPFSSPSSLGSDSFQMSSSLPNQFHQTWYGVFCGGGFQVEPGGRFVLQAGYTYHWLHSAIKTHFAHEVKLLNEGSLIVSNTATQTRVKASDGGNIGQTGWVQIDYLFSKLWRLGFGAQMHYFSTHVLSADLRQQVEGGAESSFSQKLKLRWTPISGWIQTSRSF